MPKRILAAVLLLLGAVTLLLTVRAHRRGW